MNTRYDLQFARDDEVVRLPNCWWSRHEPLVARLEYGDGRDDCEHTLWLVVTPRRIWALLALINSAVLYGLVPWLSRRILDEGNFATVATGIPPDGSVERKLSRMIRWTWFRYSSVVMPHSPKEQKKDSQAFALGVSSSVVWQELRGGSFPIFPLVEMLARHPVGKKHAD